MSVDLSRLKSQHGKNFTNTAYIKPTKPTNVAFDGFVGKALGMLKKITSNLFN